MKTIHSNPFQQLHAAESCCQAQYVSPSVSSPHADSCCAHHHADGVSGKWSSLVSGMLLLAGIVMSYIQLSWFQGTIQSVVVSACLYACRFAGVACCLAQHA